MNGHADAASFTLSQSAAAVAAVPADPAEGLATVMADDPSRLLDELAKQLEPTQADLVYAGNVIKSGILERTAHGVDFRGAAFTPYSTKGPYYYSPGTGSQKQQKMATKRLHRKLKGGSISRTGTSIRFESYAAFKQSLGRSNVDLRGPRAPHMLQAIEVHVEQGQAAVGIYDKFAADKASGHNEGAGRLPRRQFFEASEDDIDRISKDIEEQIIKRALRFMSE